MNVLNSVVNSVANNVLDTANAVGKASLKRTLGWGLLVGLLLALVACGGSAVPDGALRAPANVRSEAVAGGVRVSWEYSGEAARFNVYRAEGQGAPQKLTADPLGSSQRSYEDRAVAGGQSYRYAVTAVDEAGDESPRVESAAPVVPNPDDPAPPEGEVRLNVLWDQSSTGRGTITSSPAGIACDITDNLRCSANFAQGSVVTLQARPEAGSSFVGWSGPCSGTSSCRVTLAAATTVTATLQSAQATLTLSVAGAGSVKSSNVAGISCPGQCSASYRLGTTVGLSASPQDGHVFVGWGGDCTGQRGCNVTLDSNRSVSATFRVQVPPAPVIASLTATPNPVKAGSEVTLAWATTNAERLSLSGTGLAARDVTGMTSAKVRVTQDATFVLEAANPGGKTSRSVQVRLGKPPVIGALTATPGLIGRGDAVQLAWTVTGDGPINLTLTGVGDVSGRTGVTLAPATSTTYTLTAKNAFGEASKAVSVTVKPRYMLRVYREGRQQGLVSSDSVITCGTVCAASLIEGTRVTLSVQEPQHLERWYVCDQETAAFFRFICGQKNGRDVSVVVDKNKYVYAVFR